MDAKMLLTGFSEPIARFPDGPLIDIPETFAGHAVVSEFLPVKWYYSAVVHRGPRIDFCLDSSPDETNNSRDFLRIASDIEDSSLISISLSCGNAFDRLAVDSHILAGKQLSGSLVKTRSPSGSRGLILAICSFLSSGRWCPKVRFQRFGIDTWRQHPANRRT